MSGLARFMNYIDGAWVEPESGQYYFDMNPADEADIIGEFPLSNSADAAEAINSAERAFRPWSALPPPQREAFIERFVSLMSESRIRIGEAICREEGKTLKEAMGEPERGIEESRYFLGEGRRLEGIAMPSDRQGFTSVAVRVPLGVIAAITPWNFPFLTPLRKIIPALVTGNTVVFKPATDTPRSGALIMELFHEAGLPPGVLNMVTGRGAELGDAITSNPLVRGITFTGSTNVGRRINEVSSRHFAKVQLEMGGKNPAIVAGFRDHDAAASQIAQAAFALSGQRCTSISRVIVLREEAEALESGIALRMKDYVLGNGMDGSVTMGPVINGKAGEAIMEHIEGARAAGARIRAGGHRLSGGIYDKGFYIEPTLITDVRPEMRAAVEEIFGPVLVVIKVDSFEEAMRVANGTEYGLAASLFSDDLERIYRFQRDIESGMTHVNHGTLTDSCMPFGGVKNSGFGVFSKGATNKDFFTTWKVNYTRFT